MNGILHYKLKSQNNEEIYLSEFAVKDRFITESKFCEQKDKPVSGFLVKLLKKVI